MKGGRRVLIVVDVQNDFCPGGALQIKDGDSIIPLINGIMERFDLVVATQDWHPKNQVSFASNNPGKNIYDQINISGIAQGLATDYCVYYSAMDSLRYGFRCNVIIDATRGVDLPKGSIGAVVSEMKDKGISVISSDDIL